MLSMPRMGGDFWCFPIAANIHGQPSTTPTTTCANPGSTAILCCWRKNCGLCFRTRTAGSSAQPLQGAVTQDVAHQGLGQHLLHRAGEKHPGDKSGIVESRREIHQAVAP